MIDVLLAGMLSVAATAVHRKIAATACPGPVDPAVYADISIEEAGNSSIESHAAAWSSDCWGSREGGVQGLHAINVADATCYSCYAYTECSNSFNTANDQEYSGTVNDAEDCDFEYWATIEVASYAYGGLYQMHNYFRTGTIFASACDPPPDPGDLYDDSGCPQYQNCNSPLVINLGNGPYQLSGRNDPVMFDIDADGTLDRIGWTAPRAQIAFLAFDRNGNGTIDNGAELFGNHTPLPNGIPAANGFEALAQYDENGDGVIDARDPIWLSLMLWTDRNHDGISQPDELVPIGAGNVTAIGLNHHWTGRRDSFGNTFREEGRVWMRAGANHMVARPVYDIYFVSAP